MSSLPARALALFAATTLLLGAPAAAGAQQPEASLPDIEDEVMCPICGTALNLAESPQAERERAYIRDLIAQGLSKEEIKDELVAEFGTEVLATPDTEGFDLAAWVVPVIGVLAAAAAVAVGARRWRREGDGGPGGAAPAADELDRTDEDRLRADRARYDL